MRRLTPLWLLGTLLLMGISPRKQYLREADEATRKLVIYRGFQTALFMRATYLDEAFREQLASERQRLLQPTDEDHARFVERMRSDGALYHEVVFSADSGVDAVPAKFTDNDAGWNLRLFADGKEEMLVTVEHIRRPTALHVGIYPHLNAWSELWIARFDKTVPTPDVVTLAAGSGLGNGRMSWTDLRSR